MNYGNNGEGRYPQNGQTPGDPSGVQQGYTPYPGGDSSGVQQGYTPYPGGYPSGVQQGYTPYPGGYAQGVQQGAYVQGNQQGYNQQGYNPQSIWQQNPNGAQQGQAWNGMPQQQNGYPVGGYNSQGGFSSGSQLYRGGYPGAGGAPSYPGMQMQPAWVNNQQQAQQMGGGGYQQPQQPRQNGNPSPKRRGILNPRLLLYGALLLVLPVLFILSMFVVRSTTLKWIFVAAAVVTLLFIWSTRHVEANTRLTATVIYCALAVVVGVSAMSGGAGQTDSQTGTRAETGLTAAALTADADGGEAPVLQVQAATPTLTKDPLDSDAVRQVQSFFYFWSVNKLDDMVRLCAPSWVSSVSNAQIALFSIRSNRIPVEYTVDKISGTENDNSRTVTVTAVIDKQTENKQLKTTRFSVIVLKENGVWYVDPRSLSSSVEETATPTAEPTATATPEITTNPGMLLYYNTKGGTYYHLSGNCQAINARYYQYMSSFTWSQIDEAPYKDLQPCNICAAPLRPVTTLAPR